MTTTQATPQTCAHPGRDLAIVGLSAALVGLLAFTVVTLLNATPLAALAAGGTTLGVAAMGGLGVLSHLKRSH
ncbi:hypothetical protein [Streptomyces sp. NBC_00572]|uniref:hypothetical protein n=1 Tax=Streptomyces sp. NBC_00572 TaxID=2903664 RepID=UPI0022506706|nr:hypothetical protein [Streptomyces sp. NBC_00572]MCX4984098.1 hypothetical protein [Streptomyces sp. NBC_00572]